MSQGDTLATVLAATMALVLASRAIRPMGLSLKTKAMMAAAWLVLISGAAFVASHLT